MKKISGDERSSTFLHPNGHKMVIAHSGISALQRKQIEKIPVQHFDEGSTTPVSENNFDPSKLPDQSDQPVSSPDTAQDIIKTTGQNNPTQQTYQDRLDWIKSNQPGISDDQAKNLALGSAEDYQESKDIDAKYAAQDVQDQEKKQAIQNSRLSALGLGPTDNSNPSGNNAQPTGADTGPANLPPNPDPYGLNDYGQSQISALNQQMKGQQALSTAQGNLGAANAKIEADNQENLKQQKQVYNDTVAQMNAQSDHMISDIQNGHIDPQRYVNNMSTGGKIATAIGLILGGAGSAGSGQPNMAYQMLQNGIEKDIDAQKSELGKNMNLLSFNMQRTNNARLAEQMTRLQDYEMVQSHLRQQADLAATPMAQAQNQIIGGQMNAQIGQLKHNIAMQTAMQGAFSGQNGTGISTEMLPPDVRERVIQLPGGGMRLALDKEGAKEVRDQIQTVQPIFDQLNKLSSLGPSALIPGSPAAQKASAIRAQSIPLINENAGLKRLSGEDIGNINQMFTDPTKFSSLLGGNSKTQAFKEFLQDKLLSTMSTQLEGTSNPARSTGNLSFKPRNRSQ